DRVDRVLPRRAEAVKMPIGLDSQRRCLRNAPLQVRSVRPRSRGRPLPASRAPAPLLYGNNSRCPLPLLDAFLPAPRRLTAAGDPESAGGSGGVAAPLGSKRNRLVSRYSLSSSTAIHRRLSASHTSPVVLLPANGSRTRSPGSVRKWTKKDGTAAGKRAGCG